MLRLVGVTKRYRVGARNVVALDGVTLEVPVGALVAVWGARKSGRTTLLRVAAGIETPDDGVVELDGRAVRAGGRRIAEGVAYVRTPLSGPPGQHAEEYVARPALARGSGAGAALERGRSELERVGAGAAVGRRIADLDATEELRVAIAQALVGDPIVVLIDEPTSGVELHARSAILRTLRAIAAAGAGVLMTAGDPIELAGVDRALTIRRGALRSDRRAEPAQVVSLEHERRSRRSA